MAKTKTSFTSKTGSAAGKLGADALLKKRGRTHFSKLAKLMWKKRRAKKVLFYRG